MTPTGWRAWVPIGVSVVALAVAPMVACWTRADTRREAAGGTYAAVVERVATVEVRLDDLEADIPQSLKVVQDNQAAVAIEVDKLRADMVSTRSIAASTGYRVDEALRESAAARRASERALELLLEDMRERARDRDPKIGG